jgi:hypothetical protein
MEKKIEKSVVADRNSTITGVINTSNNENIFLRRIKTKYTILGFILGILSELIAMGLYEHFIK